jgi:uncharacterized coiled-coil protein SlyX
MTDDDPPPNVDRTHQDGIASTVLDFLEAMKTDAAGTKKIDAAGRKLFTYKVSLYLSIDDPTAPNAVRNVFAQWLNELSKFADLKGANLRVSNCKDAFLLVPSLLYDAEFQELTGWETVKPGKVKNVYICVKVKSILPFSHLKHRMVKFLSATKIFMKRNHSLGDSSEEMATIGYLSPVHPDIRLDNLQKELNQEIDLINDSKDASFLSEHGVSRDTLGEIVIAHGAVRGKSKQLGDVVNSKAVIVECPKSKAGYYLQTVQDALRTFDWSPDLRKVKFVPFGLKTNQRTSDVFTKMIVYNSVENDKKAFVQILGVSRDDMQDIRSELIDKGPMITHVEPTKLTDLQGRWLIYSCKDNLDTLSNWLTAHLASLVTSLDMSRPVPGFETPRLVVSTQISSVHVQEIEAIATTVPILDDVSTFPNLVIRRRKDQRSRGAWSSSPNVGPPAVHVVTPAPAPARTPPNFPSSVASVTSPVISELTKQLEENSAHRVQLDKSRAIEKAEHLVLKDTINSIMTTIQQDKALFQRQLTEHTIVLEQLTAGQTQIQTAMDQRDAEQKEAVAEMRASMRQLTGVIQDLVQRRTPSPLETPPRVQRTDTDSLPLSDPDDVLGLDPKRSPDRSPSKQNPRVTKLSRTTEGMDTSDDELSLRQTP